MPMPRAKPKIRLTDTGDYTLCGMTASIYNAIVDEVMASSHADFEEAGVPTATWLLLQQLWQQKLSEVSDTTVHPWDTPEDSDPPAAQDVSPGPSRLPDKHLAATRAQLHIAQKFGAGIGVPGVEKEPEPELVQQQQQAVQMADTERQGDGEHEVPAHSTLLNCGPSEGNGVAAEATRTLKDAEAIAVPQAPSEPVDHTDETPDSDKIEMPRDSSANGLNISTSDTAASTSAPRDGDEDGVGAGGGAGEVEDGLEEGRVEEENAHGDEKEEDALGSDLDDDEEEEGDEEDVLKRLLVCVYDRVDRKRNKWRCVFKNGIMSVGHGREYVFHEAVAEFQF